MMHQTIKIKSRLTESFCRRYNIEQLILFGSSVSGTGHIKSDVDVAVQPAAGSHPSKLHLIAELEKTFENRQIDLTVISKNTDSLLLFEIFSNGLLLYEKTNGLFDKNHLKAWHLYLDTKHLRDLEKAFNEDRIKALRHVT